MDEINKINLSEQTQFWLDEIKKVENYFINEISETKLCCKKLNMLLFLIILTRF